MWQRLERERALPGDLHGGPAELLESPDQHHGTACSVSFLPSGSFRTQDAGGSPFAFTYVSGNVEYWAMDHLVPSSGTSTQSVQTPGYASFSGFVSSVCGMSPPPATWATAYHTAQPTFCSVPTC